MSTAVLLREEHFPTAFLKEGRLIPQGSMQLAEKPEKENLPAQRPGRITAYRWLLEQGIEPNHIAFAGDSAGGGLAVSALRLFRDLGRRIEHPRTHPHHPAAFHHSAARSAHHALFIMPVTEGRRAGRRDGRDGW